MNPVLKKNFAVFPVLDWIATLAAHIPDKGEQLLRYYGYYTNVSRGKRQKLKPEAKDRDAPDRRAGDLLGTWCFSPHAVLYPF